jgi:hypothetical protein
VATLTVLPNANQNPAIVMNVPEIAGTNLLLGFTQSKLSNTHFTLLQSANVNGPWTTNSNALLTPNEQTGGFQFTLPAPADPAYYRVQSP